jgi:hypothetical protein
MKKKTYAAGLSVALCLLFAQSAHAEAETFAKDWAFQDAPNSGWFPGGSAGYDIHVPWAYDLSNGYGNNLWINAKDPTIWNSVNVVFDPGWSEFRGNTEICYVKAWIETGSDAGASAFHGALLDVWDQSNGALLDELEVRPAGPNGYVEQDFTLDVSGAPGGVLMDFGYWGTGTEQWMRVGEVLVGCWNSP